MANETSRRGGVALPLIVAIIVVAALAAAPLYLPTIRSDSDKLDAELNPAIAKIAAQLTAVNAGLATVADLRTQLRAEDINLSADATVAAGGDPGTATELEKQLESTARILESVHKRYPNVGTGQPLPRSLGSLRTVATATYQQFEKLLKENEAALAAAERELNAIRNKSAGEARAKDNVAINQLAALIAYQQGLIASNRADLLRRMAVDDRAAAFAMLNTVADARSVLAGIDARAPSASIEQLERLIELRKKQIDAGRATLVRLEQEIKRRTAEVEEQRRIAGEARRGLAQLERSPPSATGDFRQQYQRLADTARLAEGRVEQLEFGTLADARVDEPPGGDLLGATYHGGKVEPGLNTLRSRRDGLKSDLDAVANSLNAMEKQLEEANATTSDMGRQRDEIKSLTEQALSSADGLLKQAADRSAAARAEEAKAQKAWESAGRAAADAVRAAQQRARLAREAAAKLPPDKPNPRLKEIADDKDSEAAARFLAGQILAAQAELELNRLRDVQSTSALAATRAQLAGEAAEQPPTNELAEARKRGVELATKAIDEFAKAGKDIGTATHSIGATRIQGGFYKWQFLSAEAAAHLLLSQLADSASQRDEERERANQLLIEAARGREGSPLLSSTIETILYLQRTSAGRGSSE